jgi:modulator of FtsH protease
MIALTDTARRTLIGMYTLTGLGIITAGAALTVMNLFGLVLSGWIMPLILFVVAVGLLIYSSSSAPAENRLFTAFMFFGIMGVLVHSVVAAASASVILMALGTTTVLFLSLTAVVLITGKDFTGMGKFLFIALISAIILMLINLFIGSALLNLFLAYAVVMIFSLFILHDTSAIIEGQETDFIRASLNMFLNVANIFTSLLDIFSKD